jgi:hypothetical protein
MPKYYVKDNNGTLKQYNTNKNIEEIKTLNS